MNVGIHGLMIMQQKLNVLNDENLVKDEHTVSLCIWSICFFLQNDLYNCLLNLLGEINVWLLYYTIDSNYCCNDKAIQGVVTGLLGMS